MVHHHSAIFHTYWNKDRSVGIYSRDESWKCLRCQYVARFGYPITKQQYLETQEAWGGHIEPYRHSHAKIKERLEQLGYLDVTKRTPRRL